MKFKHGFLLGALTGTVYALLTAKKPVHNFNKRSRPTLKA